MINKEFHSFYELVHFSTIKLQRNRCKQFRNDLSLPSLSWEETDTLNSTITLEELQKGC